MCVWVCVHVSCVHVRGVSMESAYYIFNLPRWHVLLFDFQGPGSGHCSWLLSWKAKPYTLQCKAGLKFAAAAVRVPEISVLTLERLFIPISF